MGSLSDSVDDGVGVAKDILSAIRDLESALDDVNSTLDSMASGIDTAADPDGGGSADGAATGGRGGGGRGGPKAPSKPAGGAGGGGGAPASMFSMLRAHPLITGALAAGGAALPHVGAGLISASRGGDFEAGFQASMMRTMAGVPILGEASGLASQQRVRDRVASRVRGGVQAIEQFAGAGAVPEDVLRTVTDVVEAQELEAEKSRRRTDEWLKERWKDAPPGAKEFSGGFTWENRDSLMFLHPFYAVGNALHRAYEAAMFK